MPYLEWNVYNICCFSNMHYSSNNYLSFVMMIIFNDNMCLLF